MADDGRPYHHGDLKAAMLAAAEQILETEGLPALTLRAAARAVGVSHAAPQRHFGDLTGLLSELAAQGLSGQTASLAAAADRAGADPFDRLTAMGMAYVAYAQAHPGLFTLMGRKELLDEQRPALAEQMGRGRDVLLSALAATDGAPTDRSGAPAALDQGSVARLLAMWSLVHGYAVLMLDGRLERPMTALGQDPAVFFEQVLDTIILRPRNGAG